MLEKERIEMLLASSEKERGDLQKLMDGGLNKVRLFRNFALLLRRKWIRWRRRRKPVFSRRWSRRRELWMTSRAGLMNCCVRRNWRQRIKN